MRIINLRGYGDLPNLSPDLKTLKDIHDRQGAKLIVDALAEMVASHSGKFKLEAADR